MLLLLRCRPLDSLRALIIAAVLLTLNHTWIMTATEITRAKYKIRATPEEWEKSSTGREGVSETGRYELERHHNTHRNTTENTLYFVLLAFAFMISSPAIMAAQVWLLSLA